MQKLAKARTEKGIRKYLIANWILQLGWRASSIEEQGDDQILIDNDLEEIYCLKSHDKVLS